MFYAVIAFSVLILTAPLTVKFRVFLSVENKKAYYSVFLLNRFRLNSGYISVKKKYLVISYSDKRALAVNMKKVMTGSGIRAGIIRLEPLVITYSAILGGDGASQITAAIALNCFNAIIYSALKVIKPYAVYRGDVILTDKDNPALFAEITLGFCLLILLETAGVKLIGSICNYVKRKFG